MASIAIVDDHQLFTAGLKMLIEDVDGVTHCACYSSPKGLLDLAQGNDAPDLVFLDFYIPGFDSIETIVALRDRFPALRIVVLSASLSRVDREHAITAGAAAFVNKHIEPDGILEVLSSVLSGQDLSDSPLTAAQTTAEHELTARQMDILTLVSKGLSNKEIGQLLSISPETVKSHLQVIYTRFSVGGRLEAIEFARSRGLI